MLFHPDIIAAIVSGPSKKSSARKDVVDETPPIVEITKPALGNFILPPAGSSIYIEVRAKDQSGIGSLSICINGQCSNQGQCPTTTTSDYVSCRLLFPAEQFAKEPTMILGVAYDSALNVGITGIKISK